MNRRRKAMPSQDGEPTAAKSREAQRSRVSGYAGVSLGSATDAPRLPALPIGSAETRAAGSFTISEIVTFFASLTSLE